MSTLEAALRGGAVIVLLLRVVANLQNARSDRVSRWSALLNLGIAAYVIESSPGFHGLDLRWRLPIHVVTCSAPAAFWITTGAFFVDEFRPRWYHALALLALAMIAVAEMWVRSTYLFASHTALSLSCVLLAIWHALAGRAIDLVERRRRLRVLFAVVTALYTGLVVASDWLWPGGMSAASLSFVNAVGLITLVFLFAALDSLPQTSAPAAAHAGPTQTLDNGQRTTSSPAGPDAAQLAALRRLIDHDKVYREADLSIALLAQKLDIPEYRLRRLINEQLGHRNFSAFINGYRLAEAEAALGDPSQAAVPILTIALDAGFGSIGPFNRAFKAHTGLTPTEYRRGRIGGSQADEPSPIPGTG
jgi:AraC-like DNA-binding protein